MGNEGGMEDSTDQSKVTKQNKTKKEKSATTTTLRGKIMQNTHSFYNMLPTKSSFQTSFQQNKTQKQESITHTQDNKK